MTTGSGMKPVDELHRHALVLVVRFGKHDRGFRAELLRLPQRRLVGMAGH